MNSVTNLADYRRKKEIDHALEMLNSREFKREWDNEFDRELWRTLRGDLCAMPPLDSA